MSNVRTEFQVHILNEQGLSKARELGEAFTEALDKIEALVPPGRERALVITKLQEASFFAKRGIAVVTENQAPSNEEIKAPAAMFDIAMVEGLARAAEMLEKKDGGEIWDDRAREALGLARKIGLRLMPSSCGIPNRAAQVGTVDGESCASATEPVPAPSLADRVGEQLLEGALKACRVQSWPDAVQLVRTFIEMHDRKRAFGLRHE